MRELSLKFRPIYTLVKSSQHSKHRPHTGLVATFGHNGNEGKVLALGGSPYLLHAALLQSSRGTNSGGAVPFPVSAGAFH
jgi:hypothetical protein